MLSDCPYLTRLYLGLVVADQFNAAEREAIKSTLDKGKTEHQLCKPELFDKIHHRIFRDMVDRVFLPFKEAGQYQDYLDEKRKVYNKVTADDFEYLELLGAGGKRIVFNGCRKSCLLTILETASNFYILCRTMQDLERS